MSVIDVSCACHNVDIQQQESCAYYSVIMEIILL